MTTSEQAEPFTARYRPSVAVPNEAFTDETIYREELGSVFRRSWLFVGMEQMIPRPGDFVTTTMGEDSVIVSRGRNSRVRVMLNKCLHRGNKVCLFDRGNLKQFTCSYHGWSYNNAGKLTGVPGFNDAYARDLPRETMALVEARVQQYGPLIFASWEPEQSLDDFLGDMTWYLDNIFLLEGLGGLEVIPGRQRLLYPVNWKLVSENSAGDHYHFKSTHASFLRLLADLPTNGLNIAEVETPTNCFEVTVTGGRGVPHGLGQVRVGDEFYEADLVLAERLGPEAVDWARKRREYINSRVAGHKAKPYSANRAHIFPNLSLLGVHGALRGIAVITWQPHGVTECMSDQWCVVPAKAPDVIKHNAVANMRKGLGAGGMITPDDWENFARLAQNVQTDAAARQPFDYSMGVNHEGHRHPLLANVELPDLPGTVSYNVTEINQRALLQYCDQMRVAAHV